EGHEVVVLDLRGRGRSPAGSPGTHGWRRHAENVLETARLLEFASFDLVGHSMGAFIAMQAAALRGDGIRRLVLIDGVGVPEAAAIPPILAAVQRLETVYPSREAYCAMVQSHGTAVPWDKLWKEHFLYELEDVPFGVRPRDARRRCQPLWRDGAPGSAARHHWLSHLLTSWAGTRNTSRLAIVIEAAITHSAGLALPVASLIQPTMYGATKPEMLPTELTKAMPAAAAAPPRKAPGRFQNCDTVVQTPAAPIVRNSIESAVLWLKAVLRARPSAPRMPGVDRCQRRSRLSSERWLTQIIAMVPAP
ncbi:MAG: alpha/beta hydrolase, partial [Deltaproteobacteria bacterium]